MSSGSGRAAVIALVALTAVFPRQATTQTSPAVALVDTVAPTTVVESAYSITSGKLKLPGTLTLPAHFSGTIPVVLIVAGSGPTDRNGNTMVPGYAGPLPRPNSSAQMAWRLAEQGIASVRYDKRSLGENASKIDLPNVTIDDFIGDVTAGAKQLGADTRFSRVVLFGHSEGAELSLQAANRGAPVAGMIMAAGAGRHFVPILHDQLARQLDSGMMAQFDSALAEFLRGGNPDGSAFPPSLMSLLQPTNRKFMQGMQAYSPTDEIARVKVPVLIVQGGNDIQISVDDAKALAGAQPAATLLLVPEANHVLKAATGSEQAAQLPLYLNPATPVMARISSAVAEWVKGLK
jgi:pimeloyl-ACP methyl ester carboxylesterase